MTWRGQAGLGNTRPGTMHLCYHSGMTSTETGPNSNDGESAALATAPYRITFTVRGVADLLFHRWSNEDVAAKASAKRGSAIKKVDNLESYIWRDDDGMVCLPGTYVHKALIEAGKFMQDPRSSRAKQACDLFRAGFFPLTLLCPLGPTWQIEDKRRMVVNRAGITRTSPGFKAGWEATFDFEIALPEYIASSMFHEALTLAGRVIGLGQYRPTYGRFVIVKFADS
jgi:hypothetical protein